MNAPIYDLLSHRNVIDRLGFVIIMFMLLPVSIYGNGKEFNFNNYSIEQGLSNSGVLCITQDRYGFLWIGTQDGLNRFDGYEFKTYFNDQADSTSLSHNAVKSIVEDNEGYLWIGTWGGGLNRLDRRTGKFQRFQNDPSDNTSLSHNVVTKIMKDQDGNIWIATFGGGLNRYDERTNGFVHYQNDPENPKSICDNNVYGLFQDSSGLIWIGSLQGKGFSILNPATGEIQNFNHDPTNNQSLNDNTVLSFCEYKSNLMWIGTTKGLNLFNKQTGTFKHYIPDPEDPTSISGNTVVWIHVDHENKLWIGTWSGLSLYESSTDSFIRIYHNSFDLNSISGDFIWTIYEDKRGSLWFGTDAGGLSQLNRQKNHFAHFEKASKKGTTLKGNKVWTVYPDDVGYIWIREEHGGLKRLDTSSYEVKMFPHKELNNQTLTAFIESRKGTYWFGAMEGGGLYKLDLLSGKINQYKNDPYDPNSISHNSILAICTDGKGMIWIGTIYGGINRFNPETEKFTRYSFKAEPGSSAKRTVCFCVDNSGNIWAGTDEGLYVLRENQTAFNKVTFDTNEIQRITNTLICSIIQTDTGIYWFGGWNTGLIRYDKTHNKAKRYTINDGLSNNSICGIVEDNRGLIWATTKNGLNCFDPRNEIFRNFDRDDGLKSSEFTEGAICKAFDGTIYVGGVKGFNAFHPDSVEVKPEPLKLVLTKFLVFNEPYNSDNALLTKNVNLNHHQNHISIEFCALDFRLPQKVQYAYMLEGYDDDWVYSKKRRFVTYTNLEPGTYRFGVKAKNIAGVWSERNAILDIHIASPYWQTWWFRIAVVLALICILYVARRYELSKRRQLEAVRVRIASDLHDDVGVTLTKISLQSEMIQTATDQSGITKTSKSIGQLSREVVSTMNDIIWSIDARNDLLGSLIDRMHDFGLDMLTRSDIKVTFKKAGIEGEKKIHPFIRQNLYLIFKEAINNIVKHSEATQVDIHLENKEMNFG